MLRPRVISERDMMHGRHWNGQNVIGWCVTEKLDGCRGYWDGLRMWSRSGRAFAIPVAWWEKLPKMHLEGEIWAGRGRFDLAVAAVARNAWEPGVGFIVFDAPKLPGTWIDRMAEVERRLKCGFATAIPWSTVSSMKHLARIFRNVGKGGGEGLMLRCPETVGYVRGRCAQVMKLTKDPLTGAVPPGRMVVEQRLRGIRRAA